MALFAENFLKGYELGRNRKRQEELDKERAEDRKLEIQRQKLIMDRLKIQDKEEARKAARGEVDWMSTQPGVELPGPTEDGQPLAAQRHAPMIIPEGGYGQPAMEVAPQTLQAKMAQKIQADRAARMRTVSPEMASLLDVPAGEYESDLLRAASEKRTAEDTQAAITRRAEMSDAAAMARERAGNQTQIDVANINAKARADAAGGSIGDVEAMHWAQLLSTGEAKLPNVPSRLKRAVVNQMFGANMAVMTPKLEAKLDQFITAEASINHIQETLTRMNGASGMEKMSAALQLDTEVKALSRNIGRSMGEKGVFTDADKADFASLIGYGAGAPGGAAVWSMMAPEEAQKRIDAAIRLIEGVKQRELSNFSARTGGRNVAGATGSVGTSTRKKGERKTFANGNIGEWDGNSWVQVN